MLGSRQGRELSPRELCRCEGGCRTCLARPHLPSSALVHRSGRSDGSVYIAGGGHIPASLSGAPWMPDVPWGSSAAEASAVADGML